MVSDPQIEWTTLANSTYPERSTKGAMVIFEYFGSFWR